MKIWFIYAYKRVATGQHVYVGSTLDPHKRHRARVIKGKKSFPFDRALAADPEAFSYEIVEALRCSLEVAVQRENQWMDALSTFRTPGCFNFQRANTFVANYDAWLSARVAAQSTPEFLARKSAISTRVGATAAFKANMSAAMKKVMARPEVRDKVRATRAAKCSYYGA